MLRFLSSLYELPIPVLQFRHQLIFCRSASASQSYQTLIPKTERSNVRCLQIGGPVITETTNTRYTNILQASNCDSIGPTLIPRTEKNKFGSIKNF